MDKIGRPALELVLVLDISGSMGWGFDSEGGGWGAAPDKTKLAVAKRCIHAIIRKLTPADKLGIILFNQDSHTLIPLTPCSDLDRAEVAAKVDAIHTNGGTQLAQGFNSGVQMLAESAKQAKKKKGKKDAAAATTMGRRVMFLTDMDSSQQDEDELLQIASKHAANIHTTVVGVGVDVSVGTVQTLSKIPGCRYFSVSMAEEFEEIVASEFAYDVTPIAFNLKVSLSDGRKFAKGYGTSELNDLAAGSTSFKLSSEFPVLSSPALEAGGAIYLFKLEQAVPSVIAAAGTGGWGTVPTSGGGSKATPKSKGKGKGKSRSSSSSSSSSSGGGGGGGGGAPLTVITTWVGRDGKKMKDVQTVAPPSGATAIAQLGVRKAIALVRYVDLQSEYVLEDDDEDSADDCAQNVTGNGKKRTLALSKLEAQKEKHQGWVDKFTQHKAWFMAEMSACNDKSVITSEMAKVSKDRSVKSGINQNILNTVEQIIELEQKEVSEVDAAAAAALVVSELADSSVVPAASTPHEFICPITTTLMVDPVLAVDGHSYERTAIEKWFKNHPAGDRGGRVLSPMTNKPLKSLNLIPNITLRKLIQDHAAKAKATTKGKGAGKGNGKYPSNSSSGKGKGMSEAERKAAILSKGMAAAPAPKKRKTSDKKAAARGGGASGLAPPRPASIALRRSTRGSK
jgi:Mg-chelatase subunit ChlD